MHSNRCGEAVSRGSAQTYLAFRPVLCPSPCVCVAVDLPHLKTDKPAAHRLRLFALSQPRSDYSSSAMLSRLVYGAVFFTYGKGRQFKGEEKEDAYRGNTLLHEDTWVFLSFRFCVFCALTFLLTFSLVLPPSNRSGYGGKRRITPNRP